jgi:hypothetical protein
LDVAEEIWQGAVDIVEETPELNDLKERVVKVNGKKSLELKTGERYKVKAANRRAGRGLSGDLILLDELARASVVGRLGRDHEDDDGPGDALIWRCRTRATRRRSCCATCARWRTPRSATRTASTPTTTRRGADEPLDERDRRRRLARDLRVVGPSGLRHLGPRRLGSGEPVAGVHDHRAHGRLGAEDGPRVDLPHRGAVPVVGRHARGSVPAWFVGGVRDEESMRADGAEIALCVETSWDRSTTFIGSPRRGLMA